MSGEIHSRGVKETVLGVHVDDPQGSKKAKWQTVKTIAEEKSLFVEDSICPGLKEGHRRCGGGREEGRQWGTVSRDEERAGCRLQAAVLAGERCHQGVSGSESPALGSPTTFPKCHPALCSLVSGTGC